MASRIINVYVLSLDKHFLLKHKNIVRMFYNGYCRYVLVCFENLTSCNEIVIQRSYPNLTTEYIFNVHNC